MLGLCKSCLGRSGPEKRCSLSERRSSPGDATESPIRASEPLLDAKEPEPETVRSSLPDDSDPCDRSQLTVSSVNTLNDVDFLDRVQLTASSVNTILEALPETEDESERGSLHRPDLLDDAEVSEQKTHLGPAARVARSDRLLAVQSNAKRAGPDSRTLSPGSVPPVFGSKSAASSRHNSAEGTAKKPSALKTKHRTCAFGQPPGQSPGQSPGGSKERDRLPCVSFGEDVAGPDLRPRSCSDASSRLRTSSVVEWHKNKLAWLKEKRDQRRREAQSERSEKPERPERPERPSPARPKDEAVRPDPRGYSTDDELPSARSRAKSVRFGRATKDPAVDAARLVSFDWPLGKLGKLRRRGGKRDDVAPNPLAVRSASIAALTKHEAARFSLRLKSNAPSEKYRDKGKSGAALEKSRSASANPSWWGKLFFEKNRGHRRKPRSSADEQAGDPEPNPYCAFDFRNACYLFLAQGFRHGVDSGQRRSAASLSTPHRASDIQVQDD